MARKNLIETNELESLIKQYAMNKTELDSYKKLCDAESADIKQLMTSDMTLKKEGEDKWIAEVDGIIATVSLKKRETMNEERLLDIIKGLNIPGLIKTKEYVDMDELESAIYHGQLNTDDLMHIDECRETKISQELRLSKSKK